MKKYSILILIFFVGCKGIQQVSLLTNTEVRERLVEVITPADSAWLTALLECDSVGKVRVSEIAEYKTKGLQSNLNLVENKLQYKIIRQLDTIYVMARDSIVIRDVPVLIDVEKEVNKLSTWQGFQIWLGRGLLAILIVMLLRWKYKF